MRLLITLIALVGLVSRVYSQYQCYTDLAATETETGCDFCYIEYDSNLEITARGCTASGGTCTDDAGVTCCEADDCNDGTIVACYIGELESSTDLGNAGFCDADTKYCAITISGSDITDRSCEATCTPSATQACCTSNNCNDATDVTTTCLQTGATEDDSFVCAVAEAYCTVDFSGDSPVKGCEDYCTYDEENGCCSGEDCNTATEMANTCLACEDEETCADPVSAPCAMSADDFGGCYTLFYEGAPWYKDCYAADDTVCDDYDDIVCCTEDDCNDDTEYSSGIMVKSSVSFAVLISALVPIIRNLMN